MDRNIPLRRLQIFPHVHPSVGSFVYLGEGRRRSDIGLPGSSPNSR